MVITSDMKNVWLDGASIGRGNPFRIHSQRKEKKNDMGTLVAFIIGLVIGAFVGVGFGAILVALMMARGNNRDRFDG